MTPAEVKIALPANATSKTLVRRVRHKIVKALSFKLKVVDSGKTTTKLMLTNLKV